jgi:hypothetical protein
MSWLRSSPLRQSFTRRTQEIPASSITDSRAVIDSFCKHWEQVNELIGRSEVRSWSWLIFFVKRWLDRSMNGTGREYLYTVRQCNGIYSSLAPNWFNYSPRFSFCRLSNNFISIFFVSTLFIKLCFLVTLLLFLPLLSPFDKIIKV